MGGISQPRTMKMQGELNSKVLIVMVDSGASHNFVVEEVVKMLELKVEPTPKFGVRLGDGHRMQSSGLCHSMNIDLGSIKVEADCYVFPLGGVDVILGVAWLEKLGDVQVN